MKTKTILKLLIILLCVTIILLGVALRESNTKLKSLQEWIDLHRYEHDNENKLLL